MRTKKGNCHYLYTLFSQYNAKRDCLVPANDHSFETKVLFTTGIRSINVTNVYTPWKRHVKMPF